MFVLKRFILCFFVVLSVSLLISCGSNNSSNENVVNQNGTTEQDFLHAFPGAEGFGSNTIGGRGGQVIKVTNLNDSGSGSFREAVETFPRNYADGSNYVYESIDEYLARLDAYGSKIIVFYVSGIIDLESTLYIKSPYLTIAGQTSPGGILITGHPVYINTHDVIAQHLRFRTGSHRIISTNDAEVQRALVVTGAGIYSEIPGYNIIIDHCSFSWATDQVLTVDENVTNVTIQRSIISEGLNDAGHPESNHAYGLFYWGKHSDPTVKYSAHHNYIAHNRGRNPEINFNGFLDFRNNVVYNTYGGNSVAMSSGTSVNMIHNYVKTGPGSSREDLPELLYGNDANSCNSRLAYLDGNLGKSRLTQTDGNNESAFWVTYTPSMQIGLLNSNCINSVAFSSSPITTTEMSYSYALEIVNNAGATKPFRDSVDTRVAADFDNGTGNYVDDVLYPADFPVFTTPAPPVDSDNDGMADSWEGTMGFSVGIDDSTLDHDDDGYTNIEEYLHYLAAS